MDPVAIIAVLGLAFLGKNLSERYVSDEAPVTLPTVVTIEKPRENLIEKDVYSIAGGLNIIDHMKPPSTKKSYNPPIFQIPQFKPIYKNPVTYDSSREFEKISSVTRNVNPANLDGAALLTTAAGLDIGISSGYTNGKVTTKYGAGGQGYHYGAVQPKPILTNADVLVNGTFETGTKGGYRGAAVVNKTPLDPKISGYSSIGGITEPPAMVFPIRNLAAPPIISPATGSKSYSAVPDSLYSVFPTLKDQILSPQTGGLQTQPMINRSTAATFQPMNDIRSHSNNTMFASTNAQIPSTAGEQTHMRTDSKHMNYVIPNKTSEQNYAPLGITTDNAFRGQFNPRGTLDALKSISAPLKTNPFTIPSFSVEN
jgi:hypothetical protein